MNWLKLDMDGSAMGNPGKAGGGGIIWEDAQGSAARETQSQLETELALLKRARRCLPREQWRMGIWV